MSALMPHNMSSLDRVVRVIGGIALIAAFFLVSGPWHWVGILGFVFLATAVVNTCPIYTALGLSTRSDDAGAGAAPKPS